MAENRESTTRLNVDIADFKKSIQDAQRQIRLANAEFKAASSGMDDWSSSADGINAKLKQLRSTLQAQETVLNALERQYAEVAQEQGENSRAAQELAIKINNQKAAINNTNRSINQYEQALGEIDSESSQAESSAEELAESIEDAGENAKKAEGGFTVLKGALASLVADGIKAAVSGLKDLTVELINDSSNAYAQFAAATGTATDAMGEYEEAIKNVYKNNFGDSLEDVAEKMAKVKEVTGELDASKLEDMTEKVMTLEDTFDMDISETLRGVQALMNNFGLTSEEAFDLISSGAQNGLNYTDELGDNLSEYSAKFSEAGYSAEEYFQLLQNGTDGGAYNLDKVNDAINEVTTRLADGTISDSLGSFSEKTQDVFKAWQNGEATQKEVINSIVSDIQNTTGEQEKMNLAALAFGTMAEDGGTKFIEALTPVGDTFDNVKGKADELASVKYDTPMAAISSIGRTLKTDLLQPLVDKLTPALSDLANWVTNNLPSFIQDVKDLAGKAKDVATTISDLSPLFAALGTAIAGLAIVGLIQNIGTIATAFKTWAASTKIVTAAQWLLNAAMSANPITLIVIAIAALVAAFVVLWNKSDSFREFWINLWEKVKSAVSAFLEFFKNLPENVKTWFDNTITKAKEFATNMKKKATETGKNFINKIIEFIKNLPSKVWTWLLTTIAKVIAFRNSIIEKAKSSGSEFVTNLINKIKELPSKMWEKFKEVITKVVNFFKDINAKATEKGKEFVTNLINKIKTLPSDMWNKFKEAIAKVTDLGTKLKEKAQEAGTKLVSGIKEKIKSLPDEIKTVGANIVTGLWNGINDKFSWLTSKIKNFATDVTDELKSFFGIHSPSRVMQDEVGKYLALGVAEGITENKAAVNEAMKSLKNDVTGNLNFGVSSAKNAVLSGTNYGGVSSGKPTSGNAGNSYTFNQYNNSPKALSRLEIYRQTKNQLKLAKGV